MKIPPHVSACLWSYDASTLDLKRDRRLIVTQVLNRGDWRSVQWLLKTYPKKEIAAVLKNPGRGLWMPDVLNFWYRLWGIRLSKPRYENALLRLYPKTH